MKKTILVLLVLIGSGSLAHAQFSDSIRPYPHRQLQVAMSVTDFITNRVRLESSYRFDRQHALGLGGADLYGRVNLNNHMWDSGNRELSGYFLSAHHKYYLYGSYFSHYMFMRSSVNFQHSRIAYESHEWVEYEENGNSLMTLLPVDKEYGINSLGINFEIGFEAFYEVWFLEASLGVAHRSVLSTSDKPAGANSGSRFGDIDYTGLAPVIGLRVGAYLF